MSAVEELRAEYLRLQGVAATEQQRFGFSARPNFLRLAEAGAAANRARTAWMDAMRDQSAAN